jgi:hypothetical protein
VSSQVARRYTLVAEPSRNEGAAPLERRRPSAPPSMPVGERVTVVPPVDDLDAGLLRRFLESLRRDLAAEAVDVRVTVAAIERTVEYLLSPHLDEVDDGELDAAVATLRGYLSAVIDEAGAVLDDGRVVSRTMLQRARDVADRKDSVGNRTAVREAAKCARDLLALMRQAGWQGPEPAPYGNQAT